MEHVNEHPSYNDNPPVRNTILTRLAEMVRKERIARWDDGRYAGIDAQPPLNTSPEPSASELTLAAPPSREDGGP